jgi:hypothetical protein
MVKQHHGLDDLNFYPDVRGLQASHNALVCRLSLLLLLLFLGLAANCLSF